jgi:hypothetical protein
MEILRLSGPKLNHAREELISEALVSYKRPYWEVKNISQRRDNGRDDKADDTLSSGRPATELFEDGGRCSQSSQLLTASEVLSPYGHRNG